MQKEKNRNLVFILSVCLTLLICLWGILLPDSFGTAAGNSMRFLTINFAWLYCLAMTLFVAFCLWIGLFSKYRNIPLGPDGAKPEYSKSAWFSMLFCAGMGVGLVFWGAAETMNYFGLCSIFFCYICLFDLYNAVFLQSCRHGIRLTGIQKNAAFTLHRPLLSATPVSTPIRCPGTVRCR